MRKQRTAARGLVDELVAQRLSVDGDEQQIVLSFEVPGGRFDDLIRGRKMNESVGKIYGCAGELARPSCFVP